MFVSIFTVYSIKTPEESITEKPSAEKYFDLKKSSGLPSADLHCLILAFINCDFRQKHHIIPFNGRWKMTTADLWQVERSQGLDEDVATQCSYAPNS